MKTVEDFIKVYDIFDKEYCQELIDYFNNGKPEFKNNDNKPRFHQIEFEEPMMEMMIWRVAPFLDKYVKTCLLYTSPSPRDSNLSRMPSSA